MKRKKVCYLVQSSEFNIGNAFIDIGAIRSISNLVGEENLILVSEFPLYRQSMETVFKLSTLFNPFWKVFGGYIRRKSLDKLYKMIKPGSVFSLMDIIKADYFVISGCVLTVPFFRMMGELLQRLRKKGTEIIFYGCGSNSYSRFEIDFVSRNLRQIQPLAIVTRDSIAFKHYGHLARYAFNGIDCAFFVNMLPLEKIELKISNYVVLTFDQAKNRKIEKELENNLSSRYKIIKLCHTPLPRGHFFASSPNKSDFVSTSPYDYLILYSHAIEVYADRVHACIPSLSFGRRCAFYGEEFRTKLFEKVCSKHTIGGITYYYPRSLHKWQKEQLHFLSNVLEK